MVRTQKNYKLRFVAILCSLPQPMIQMLLKSRHTRSFFYVGELSSTNGLLTFTVQFCVLTKQALACAGIWASAATVT
jgi:hypothetical protein